MSGSHASPARKMVESLPHLVWTCDGDGSCDYLSPQWVQYTGIPAEEQLGSGWLEQLHPDDRALTQERWAAAGESKSTFDTEFRIRRHDGEYRWFKTRAVPELGPAGEIVAWFGTNTDIQDLKDVQEAHARLAAELEERVSGQTEALRSANERLRTVAIQLETAQRLTRVGSWELDVASGEVVWSDELYRVFGLPPGTEPPSYDTQANLFTPESWTRLTTAVADTIESGQGYELLLTALDASGQHRLTVARAEPIRDEATGAIVRLVGTFQDITDRREAEETLRRLTERFELATRAARIGVWDWDMVAGTLVWNETMHELYGTDPSEFSGSYEAWRSALHPDDLEGAEQLLQDAIEGRAEFRITFRIQVGDGEIRYIRAESNVTRDAEGRAVRVTGVNQDITERRVAEITLRRAEALQRGILEAAGLALIVTDTDGTITRINPAAEELIGYRAEELVGRATPGVFHDPAEVAARQAELEAELGVTLDDPFETFVVKSRQGSPDANEWTYVRKDGTRVPVWLVVSTIRDGDDVLGYLGVAADLTDRKRHEDELLSLNDLLAQRSDDAEAASRAKSRFLANMSHEIRTPIGAITGVTYLLSRTALSPEQSELVGTIERSTGTLLAMVNDVLDLSKIEAGQLRLEEGVFSLASVLQDLSTMMAAYAADKELELVVDTEADIPDRLVGDRVRLMQILVNLTGNAIKFTDQGSVRVTVARAGERIRFQVTDTGVGMAPERTEQIFRPFTQAHARSRPGGTGLGLAIVQELATLMHGEVGLSSEVGVGTEVWVELPLEGEASAARSSSPTIGRVLLVASRPLTRQSFGAHATALGWRVTVAATGREALALAREAAPDTVFDLVVVEHSLSDMSGLDVLDQLAAGPGGRPASVLLTSDEERAGLRGDPRMAVADAVLGDAISSSSLYDAAVQAAVRHHGPGDWGAMDTVTAEVERLPGVRVLVVDDTELNRLVARRILELEGATVIEASNGLEAVRRAADVDLILMDIQMPGLDGFEASRRICESGGAPPILALTAGAFRSKRDHALEAGMVDFITKPYDPEALIAKVRAHVSRARGAQVGVASRSKSKDPSGEWPVVDGIDEDTARGLLGGDRALFRRLLTALQHELDDAVTSDRMGGDRDAVKAWLHKLRGAAGNVGARKLHGLASQAERALHEGDEPLFERAAAALRVELERLRQGIRSASVVEPKPPRSAPSDGDAAALDSSDLQRILTLLSEQSFTAVDEIAALDGALVDRLSPLAYAELQSALGRLDFAKAHALIAALDRA